MSESLTVWTQFNKHVFGLWEEAALPRETPQQDTGRTYRLYREFKLNHELNLKTLNIYYSV